MIGRGAVVALASVVLAGVARAQGSDSAAVRPADSIRVRNVTPLRTEVSGAITVTTKGISTIPTFTLGKPAAIVDLSVRRRGLSLDPQIRYGLNGRPWTFLFWGRYRLLDRDRYHVSLGAHPAVSFVTRTVSIDGAARDVLVARRYLASEVYPTYVLSRSATLGAYWLYSRGIGDDVTRHTNYIAVRSFHSVRLPAAYSLRLAPQAYYLKLDDLDGTYANAAATLARRNLPFSVSTSATRKLRTDLAGDAFIWNVSLTYAME